MLYAIVQWIICGEEESEQYIPPPFEVEFNAISELVIIGDEERLQQIPLPLG